MLPALRVNPTCVDPNPRVQLVWIQNKKKVN